MKNKFEFLGRLPKDLVSLTAPHLVTPVLIQLSEVSKGHRAYFAPILEERKALQKFLHHVVRGEHDSWTEMLKKDPYLLSKKDQVTDLSDRTFLCISAFEYALWALDKHTWTMMLECLPKTEEGKKVLEELIAQYDKVNLKGVTYALNGTITTEKHFDFNNTIIKELKAQIDSTNADKKKDGEAIAKQWLEGVGGAQKLLPTHVVNEYCSKELFDPETDYTAKPKSSTQFFNSITNEDESWFSAHSKLSVEFAILKGHAQAFIMTGSDVRSALRHGARVMPGSGLACDLDAMTALCKVRTNDFIDLKSQLEDQMTLDMHHQLPHM